MARKDIQEARAESVLSKPIRSGGQVMTRQQWLEKLASEGYEPDIWNQRKYYEDEAREKLRKWVGSRWIPTGNPNHPDTKAYERKRQEIWDGMIVQQPVAKGPDGSMFDLGKIEYEYLKALKQTQTPHSR